MILSTRIESLFSQRVVGLITTPRELATALMLLGAVVVVAALGADLVGIGSLTIGAKQITVAIGGLAILLSGVVLAVPVHQRNIGDWLFVGLSVIAVGMAADLVTIVEQPKIEFKLLMLTAIGFSLILTRTVLILADTQPADEAWPRLLTLVKENSGKFFSVAIQLGLLSVVIRQYHIENQLFWHSITLLIFYGFLLHYFLALRYRLTFFLLLSLVAVVGTFGLPNGAWLIGVGLVLIGLCHLPISFPSRVGLLLLSLGLLAAMRANWIPSPWSGAIWPILGSMFMFRLIVYMYDLRHQKEPIRVSQTLSYFFLLPNICFPLFPVVDYKTFCRTYYDDEEHLIYQRGVKWILRGIMQLIVYRAVYYYMTISPTDVANVADLVRYLISNFLLYLRISGEFHLIVGILHLFGFHLPETHHLYYLASSFTDFWRRINIYWKDFMMKVFYYPAYFWLRKWGDTTALVLATLFVFVCTWTSKPNCP